MEPISKLVSSARASSAPMAPLRPVRHSKMWESSWATKRLEVSTTRGFYPSQPLTERQHNRTPSHCERTGVQQLVQWIEQELEIQGLHGSPPSVERARVFSTAFSEVIDLLPSYRPILLSVQKEYDSLVNRLQAQIAAVGPVEGRFKTVKAESFSFVAESMSWFQMELATMKRKLGEAEQERDGLREEREELAAENVKLAEASERDRSLANELHGQNLDVLRHLERMETEVDRLRVTEKETQGHNTLLEQKVRERDLRISTVEEQLNLERERANDMVPREDFEALREKLNHAEASIRELQETNAARQKDYLSLVESYSRNIGQKLADGYDARPLTPRPTWFGCRGLLDVDALHSTAKAETAQELLQHMLACSRTLIAAYGLHNACQKSNIFQRYARHELVAPLVSSEDAALRRANEAIKEENGDGNGGGADGSGHSRVPTLSGSTKMREADAWLPPDTDSGTPEVLRHPSKVKNLRLSRKRTSEFIESIMALRSRGGVQSLSTPFLDFMLDHIPEEYKTEDANDFAINVYSAVLRYAAEPDFLAYLLLLKGKISDAVVKDNRSMCAELLRIFMTHFESGDGTKMITKQKFFYGLREVLQNKEKDMWQELVNYFPIGGPDVTVNYEWLLMDDMYVLSPIVYALRLQHLEEAVSFGERLEKVTRGSLKDGQLSVRYEVLEAAFKGDEELGSLLQPEDFAKAFGIPVRNLKPSSEQEVGKVMELMKHGDAFRLLYFPALPSDDAEAVT